MATPTKPITPELWAEYEQRMEIIGQNGNDGEHYDERPEPNTESGYAELAQSSARCTATVPSNPDCDGKHDGQKFDAGKTRYDLVPPEALEQVARVLTFGASKYADRNWERGINYGRVFGACMRHLWAWWRGETHDQETGITHLAHAGCCIFFLITYEARGLGDKWDDRHQ